MGQASWKRWPFLLMFAAALVAAAILLDRFLTFDVLAAHREWLLARVEAWGAGAPLAFIAVYATAAGLSIPGAVFLSILGGFLFGPVLGTVYAVLGATLGATIIFLLAKSTVGAFLRRRAGPFIRKVEEGFRRNAFWYLLSLRLLPFMPFWLVNLLPALLGVPLATFVLATLIGIIPATAVFVGLGDGLGALLDAGQTPDLDAVLQPRVLLPLLALAALSLVPVAVRQFRRRPAQEGA